MNVKTENLLDDQPDAVDWDPLKGLLLVRVDQPHGRRHQWDYPNLLRQPFHLVDWFYVYVNPPLIAVMVCLY